jgi:membrane associated rhomboid family serine protease
MDVNHLLIWIVCFSCFFLLVRSFLSSWRNNIGWMIVCGSILTFTLALVKVYPDQAGWVGGALGAIFILLPRMGLSWVHRLVCQQRYHSAYRLASYLRWLHPADGWWDYYPQILRALAIAQQGHPEGAIAILSRYQAKPTALARETQALMYFIKADWAQYREWVEQSIPKQVLVKDPLLLVYYLRALGETGDLNKLLHSLDWAEKSLQKRGERHLIRLFALAFCGQTLEVRQLLKRSLALYCQPMHEFWIATAQMVAGKTEMARAQLSVLGLENDLILRNAIDWRLCHLPIDPEPVLERTSRQILYRLKTEIERENQYNYRLNARKQKAYVTYSLIGLNLAFFMVELERGGSENLDTLYNLGGLVPQAVMQGAWWRLLSANFLHYGWLHLLTNMLGLYFLGRLVEVTLGRGRYLAVYGISGIGTMGLFTLLATFRGEPEQILVGASAAIMGLVGAIAAIFWRDWQREKSRIAAKRLQIVLFMIGCQFLFDWSTPQVSFLSHFLGVALGFMSASLLPV